MYVPGGRVSERVPWTVVCPAADRSAPASAAAALGAWLAEDPSVDLHSVLWGTGYLDVASFAAGRFTDVSAVHRRLGPRALRRAGLVRVGGGLTGQAVRARLRAVARDGVLYLSSAHSAAVLRYLPAGRRTVVTHLHALDQRADPPLAEDKVAALLDATDVWLADDEETRAWAASAWDIGEGAIGVVAPPVDPCTWNRAMAPTCVDQLRLGVAGGEWFGRDHTPRLVKRLLGLRPSLDLQLVWTRAVTTTEHLGPLRHDLDRLGMDGALELSPLPDGIVPVLDDIDALVLTVPDEEAPWLTREALDHGVPVVCFDTHRAATALRSGGGAVVPYPDVTRMAQALIDINEGRDDSGATTVVARRTALRARDVRTIGPRIVDLVTGRPS